MSEQQEKSGIGAAGFVGGAAAGVGGGIIANNIITDGALKNVARDDPKATKKFIEAAEKVLEGFASKTEGVKGNFKEVKRAVSTGALIDLKPESIDSLRFLTDPKTKKVSMAINSEGAFNVVKGIEKLPEGIASGVTMKGDALKNEALTKFIGEQSKAVTKTVEQGEKLAIKNIRKAGGMGFGFKNMGVGGKTAVIGAVVAAAAAGTMVAHQLFGGKHSDKARSEDRGVAPGRA